jgi:hypothetical protein
MVWIVNRFTGGVNRSNTCGNRRTPSKWANTRSDGAACVANCVAT